MEHGILVNARSMRKNVAGIPRYVSEVTSRLNAASVVQNTMRGIGGHLWEQAALPIHCRKSLLFSPANIGPVAVSNQVVTIHDIVPVDLPEFLNWKFAAWYKLVLPKLVKRVRHIIAISEFTKSRLIDAFDVSPDKISVVMNGVCPRFKPASPQQILTAIHALDLPTRKYILSLGSLEPRKNLTRVFDAWIRALPNLPEDVWLVVAGKKGNPDVFRSAGLEQLPPRVHMTGYVEDEVLPVLISGAMAFIYMSIYEGFGLPPLEAMASGVPVVVSDKTAIPEVVGDSGLYADPFNCDDIAHQLVRIATDDNLRDKMKWSGLDRAKLFSWDKCATQTQHILDVFSRG
jgi:glycosyltransferase involved in cell wall biosynthesis